jgi:hypothetical protein
MDRSLRGSEEGLVGYWKFNEGEGETATDSSPNHNDGMLGAAGRPGRLRYSRSDTSTGSSCARMEAW